MTPSWEAASPKEENKAVVQEELDDTVLESWKWDNVQRCRAAGPVLGDKNFCQELGAQQCRSRKTWMYQQKSDQAKLSFGTSPFPGGDGKGWRPE